MTSVNGRKQQAPTQSSQGATNSSTKTTSANGSEQQAPTQSSPRATSSSTTTTSANGGMQQAPVQSSQRATSSSTTTTSANGGKQPAPTQSSPKAASSKQQTARTSGEAQHGRPFVQSVYIPGTERPQCKPVEMSCASPRHHKSTDHAHLSLPFTHTTQDTPHHISPAPC